jgi:hypothetical protein
MGKGFALCCACGAWFFVSSVAFADTVYTNQADWLAAVSSLGAVHTLSLAPVAAVPDTGASYVDDEGTLVFPDNHRGIQVYADGWKGDVHDVPENPFDHQPHENHFTFDRPIVAFGATVWVGSDLLPEVDSILLNFDGGAQHRLGYLDYSPNAPAFFGWVGDAPAATLSITSGAGSYFYSMTGVQYVRPQPAPAGGPIDPVPLPKAAWGGLALLAVGGLLALHRHRHVTGETP